MEKLPKYATITIDEQAFGKLVFKGVKDTFKKHGISKLTVEILSNLSSYYYQISKRENHALTLSDTQKIESILSKSEKPSVAKLFIEDKFSKNNNTEISFAHKAVKDVYSYYIGNIETTIGGNTDHSIDEVDLGATYLEDLSLHIKLAFAILSKKMVEAKEIIASMDTSPREYVPSEVYEFVMADTQA